MILQLNNKEMAALVLHMSIMRKNVRKGFKSNYGNDSKKVIASYDEVKNTVATALETTHEDDSCYLHFNIKEVDMLFSFLEFYVMQLHDTLDFKKISSEDNEQIECLKMIKSKTEELKAA